MPESNEVQIVISAVDKASTEIKKVTKSLDDLSGNNSSATQASTSINKVNTALNNTATAATSFSSSSTKITSALTLINRVAPGVGTNLAAISRALGLIGGVSITAGTAVASAFAAVAAAAVAGAVITKKSADSFSKEVLDNWINYSPRIVAAAQEYTDDMSRIASVYDQIKKSFTDLWGDITVEAWTYLMDKWGYQQAAIAEQLVRNFGSAAGIPINIDLKPKITQEDFNNLVKAGVDAANAAAKEQGNTLKSIFTTAMGLQPAIDKSKELYDTYVKIRDAGPKEGDIEGYNSAVATAKQNWLDAEASVKRQLDMFTANKIIDMITAEGSAGGAGITDAERNAISQFMVDTGLASSGTINTVIDAYNTAAGKVAQIASDTTAAAQGTLTKVGEIKSAIDSIKDKTITITVNYVDGENKDDTTNKWTGGAIRPGQRAIVGDAPGGRLTPYSEMIEPLQGGGVRIYSAPQTRSMMNGMRSFASGGDFNPTVSVNSGIDYDKMAMIVRDAVLLVAK